MTDLFLEKQQLQLLYLADLLLILLVLFTILNFEMSLMLVLLLNSQATSSVLEVVRHVFGIVVMVNIWAQVVRCALHVLKAVDMVTLVYYVIVSCARSALDLGLHSVQPVYLMLVEVLVLVTLGIRSHLMVRLVRALLVLLFQLQP